MSVIKLFQLAAKGNAQELSDLIQLTGHEDVLDCTDHKGRKLIHVAAANRNTGCVYELLKLGEDVHSRCLKGHTALHYACATAWLPCMVTLLQMDASLRITNVNGETPLDVIPQSLQVTYGTLLRETENEQKKIRQTREDSQKHYTNFPTASQGHRTAVDSIYPIPFITEDFSCEENVELARGPNVRYCKGKFSTSLVTVKYSPEDVYTRTKDILINEAIVLGNLRHPNILLLLGMTSPPTHNYKLVFENAHAFLHRAIFTDFTFHSEQVLRLTRDITAALHYIHHRGYIHCSMGSHSVTLSEKLTAKICNFENSQLSTNANSISHLVSSHPYMAPEQLSGHKANALNDVYAVGVIAFECATKKSITDVRQLLKNFKQKDAIDFMAKLIPKTFEKSVSTLIISCLQKAKRRANALQVYQWTDALLECGLPSASPLSMITDHMSRMDVTTHLLEQQ